jgi:hypothetical protein
MEIATWARLVEWTLPLNGSPGPVRHVEGMGVLGLVFPNESVSLCRIRTRLGDGVTCSLTKTPSLTLLAALLNSAFPGPSQPQHSGVDVEMEVIG